MMDSYRFVRHSGTITEMTTRTISRVCRLLIFKSILSTICYPEVTDKSGIYWPSRLLEPKALPSRRTNFREVGQIPLLQNWPSGQ
jgi:hypothetical protein